MFCVIVFVVSFFVRIQLVINMDPWHAGIKHGKKFALAAVLFGHNLFRDTQQEYSSKSLKHCIVERILVFFGNPLKLFHLFGFPSWKSSDPKIIGIKTYLFENFSQKKGSRKF